jgi:hypothetical protein
MYKYKYKYECKHAPTIQEAISGDREEQSMYCFESNSVRTHQKENKYNFNVTNELTSLPIGLKVYNLVSNPNGDHAWSTTHMIYVAQSKKFCDDKLIVGSNVEILLDPFGLYTRATNQEIKLCQYTLKPSERDLYITVTDSGCSIVPRKVECSRLLWR